MIWVGVDGEASGALRCEDAIRITAKDAVDRLRAMGAEVVILTGDNAGSARRVAAACDVPESDVKAGLTPAAKMEDVVRRVKCLERTAQTAGAMRARFFGRGTLAMVGDGVNDAPALGAADVGVAMGVAGSAAAMETADVALLTNELTKIAETVAIGRLCLKKIRENIAFSLVTKGAVLALCLRGKGPKAPLHPINLLMFVALHELTHIAVTIHDHPPEYWAAFKWLLGEAVEAGVYLPDDFRRRPQMFCGTRVDYQPLFDGNLPAYV